MAEVVYEVLSQRPDGHQTVSRVKAASKAVALDAVVERGVPRAEIVSAEAARPA